MSLRVVRFAGRNTHCHMEQSRWYRDRCVGHSRLDSPQRLVDSRLFQWMTHQAQCRYLLEDFLKFLHGPMKLDRRRHA
jgi:hypothetical protein